MGVQPQDSKVDARIEVGLLLKRLYAAAEEPARVRQITDALEVCVMSHFEPPEPDPLPKVRLTKMQRRLFMRLWNARGRVVMREQLMNALYYDRLKEEPGGNIINVMMAQIRPRLVGSGFSIETVYCYGHRLIDDPC